jgi:hypothetical protein
MFNYRVPAAYRPNLFTDARRFGSSSISVLIARWWPLYAFGLIAVIAGSLTQINPWAQRLLVLVFVTTPVFVTCATRFRGTFSVTPRLFAGVLLTFVIPVAVPALLFFATLWFPLSARLTILLLLVIVFFWLGPKLIAAGCFYLLGADDLTPSESYALAWKFIAGDRWVVQFLVGLIGALVAFVPLAFVMLLRQPALSSIVRIVIDLPLNLYYFSALMRIVSTAPELYPRYWEASKNSAQ